MCTCALLGKPSRNECGQALPRDWDDQAPAPSPGVFDSSEAARIGTGKRVHTQFEGTIKMDEELLSKFPNLPGLDKVSIFAKGQTTASPSRGFSLDDLTVTVAVEAGAYTRPLFGSTQALCVG